jgi:DNA polymerase
MLPFNNITQARGRAYKTTILGLELTVFPTFHPASALYNPEYKKILEHDFQLLRKKLPKMN